MQRVMRTEEDRAFWRSFDESVARVRQLPYCLRGGSAAERQEREFRELEEGARKREAARSGNGS